MSWLGLAQQVVKEACDLALMAADKAPSRTHATQAQPSASHCIASDACGVDDACMAPASAVSSGLVVDVRVCQVGVGKFFVI
jgi:hypothetical protein